MGSADLSLVCVDVLLCATLSVTGSSIFADEFCTSTGAVVRFKAPMEWAQCGYVDSLWAS